MIYFLNMFYFYHQTHITLITNSSAAYIEFLEWKSNIEVEKNSKLKCRGRILFENIGQHYKMVSKWPR